MANDKDNLQDEFKNRLVETKRKNSQAYQWFSILGALLAGLSLVIGFFSVTKVFPSLNNQSIPYQLEQQQKQVDALKLELAGVKAQLDILQTDFQNYDKPGAQPTGLQLKAVTDTLTNLQTRIGNLDTAILDSPTKALTVPLLRKDLDSLRDSYQANAVVTKSDIDRIYDLNKWFIGLMLTSTVGIIALAVSNFFKRA